MVQPALSSLSISINIKWSWGTLRVAQGHDESSKEAPIIPFQISIRTRSQEELKDFADGRAISLAVLAAAKIIFETPRR